jgi:hypothetical protein
MDLTEKILPVSVKDRTFYSIFRLQFISKP